MNKSTFLPFLFIALLLLQVLVLNNINFLGYINPYLYIAFIFFYPLQNNRFAYLFIAFLLGLSMDFFLDSGGIHAFATLTTAYIRKRVAQVIFQKSEKEFLLFNLKEEAFGMVFNYIVLLTVFHHFILFTLTIFSFNNLKYIITNTLYSSIFTIILFFLGTFIFTKRIK